MPKKTKFEEFSSHYKEAIAASGNPDQKTVNRIVVDLLDNPDTAPESSELWPIVMYIRLKLQDPEFPTNWLRGKVPEKINVSNNVLAHVDRLLRLNKINFISDVEISDEVKKRVLVRLLLKILEKIPSPDKNKLFFEDIVFINVLLKDINSDQYHLHSSIKLGKSGLTSNEICTKIKLETSN